MSSPATTPNDELIFYCPHPNLTVRDVLVITENPYSQRIAHLWNLAKALNPRFGDVYRASCIFYLPSDLPIEPADTLFSRSRDWLRQHREDGRRACISQFARNAFLAVPPPDGVHILVVNEEILEGLDDLGDLGALALKQRTKGIKSFRDSLPSPLSGVSSFEGVERVVSAKNNFHAGRPAGNFGPPVSLFNHALGLFDYHLRHLDDESSTVHPPPALIELAHQFMVAAANSYPTEFTRVAVIKDILSRIVAVPLNWEVSQAQFGIWPNAINLDDTPFFVVEVTNEAGLEGDASLQAALSYAHIASSPLDKDSSKPSNYPAVLSNCPAVLCGIMGNLLEIGVATYTDGPYYNLLFSERLCLGFYAAKNLLRLARAFTATRHVVADLRQFYTAALPIPGNIAHLFPSPLPVPTYTGFVPTLTFTRRVSRSGETVVLAEDEATRQSGIYLATMTKPRNIDEDTVVSSSVDDTSEVVVKFTAQYHPEAHCLLAKAGLAPALHACVPVCGGLFMVVMDRVHGEIAWKAVQRGGLLPYEIYKDIENAVALLHSNDLVFGDLRTPNIIVVPGGSGSDARRRGMLIDFDWVGVHEIGRYPASLDNCLPDWVSGIKRYGIMDKAHDLAMLTKFKRWCHSV